jgi:hypothetical protein
MDLHWKHYNIMYCTLVKITSSADCMTNDGVALEEKEEDSEEFHHHRFRLNTVQHG